MENSIEKQFNKYFLPVNKFRLASTLKLLKRDLDNIAVLNELKLDEKQALALKAVTKKIQTRVDNFDTNFKKTKPKIKAKTKMQSNLKTNRLSTLLMAFLNELTKQGIKIEI